HSDAVACIERLDVTALPRSFDLTAASLASLPAKMVAHIELRPDGVPTWSFAFSNDGQIFAYSAANKMEAETLRLIRTADLGTMPPQPFGTAPGIARW